MDFTKSKITFSLQAYDRPHLLAPCLQSVQAALDADVIPHVSVDDSGSHPEIDRLVDASGFEVHRPAERFTGFYQNQAMHRFLADETAGDILVVSDSDMILGESTFTAVRDILTLWWGRGFSVGMLCAGIRYNNFEMRGLLEVDDDKLLLRRGSEAFCAFPREALSAAFKARNGFIRRMASLKNSLQVMGYSRATPMVPHLPVAHSGAFISTKNPQTQLRDQLFLDNDKNPLNPRPDLFDVQEALETCAS